MRNYFIGEINSENLREAFGYKIGDTADITKLFDKDVLKELDLEWGIIYCYDRIITDSVDNLDFDLDNVMEASIFNETCELKVWRNEDTFKGSIFRELGVHTSYLEEKYILYPRNTGGANPSRLKVKKYMDCDNDGQAYISYVKPAKFE